MPRRLQFRLRSLFLLVAFAGILFGVGKWSYDEYVASLPAQLPWKPYSRAEMGTLRSSQRPVLVFFMADWDMNGIVVLRYALGDHEVAAELKRHRFEYRLADWTEANSEIEQALNDYGAVSIPVIVFHPAGKFDKPVILRDLVSKEQLLEAIKKATSPPVDDESE